MVFELNVNFAAVYCNTITWFFFNWILILLLYIRQKKKRFMFPVTCPKWKFRVDRHQPFFFFYLFFLLEAKNHIKWRKCWLFGHFCSEIVFKIRTFLFLFLKVHIKWRKFWLFEQFCSEIVFKFRNFLFLFSKVEKKVRVGGF